MEINKQSFFAMLETQIAVNNKVGEKIARQPSALNYITAYQVEFYEYVNKLGIWKWWKHSHKLDRVAILDELADCFAFFLSAILTLKEELEVEGKVERQREKVFEMVEAQFNDLRSRLENLDDESARYNQAIDIITEVATIGEAPEPKQIGLVLSFSAALVLLSLIFPDITWEEVVAAYNQKSEVNIKRQEQNY